MTISLLTVSLNSVDTITGIESIRTEDYKEFESIVVDGNSIDGAINILKSNDGFNSKLTSELDKGIYYAMPKIVKMASV